MISIIQIVLNLSGRQQIIFKGSNFDSIRHFKDEVESIGEGKECGILISGYSVFNNFNVVDYEWLEQKTYPPRQLNRVKSIKGDVLVTFRKNPEPVRLRVCDDEQFTTIVSDFITETIENGITDTNGIMMAIMEWIFRNMIIVGNVDVFMILNKQFQLSEDGHWNIK